MFARSPQRGIRRAVHGIAAHRVWTAIVVIALAGGGTAVYLATRGADPATAGTTYRVVSAAMGTVRQSVSTTGTLEPAEQESLSFPVSGKVTSVRVAAGDKVTKGQVLATVNSAALKATLAQAQASLANAKASLVSAQDASASAAQITADTAAVAAGKESVSSAQTALADATLTSPITGQVASVDLAVGDQVTGSGSGGSGGGSGGSGSSGSSGGSGSGLGGSGAGSTAGSTSSSSSSSTAQFLVISTNSWTVTSSVDATQVGLIAKGDQAQLTIDGAAATVFGTISSIGVVASSGSSSSSSASFPVDIAVTGSPSGLHAGTSATVQLIYKQLSNVLTVPTLAVHVANGASVVYVSADGTATGKPLTKKVTTGLSSGGVVQIDSGLSAGDKVLVQVPTRVTGGTSSTSGGNTGRFGGGGTFGGGTFGGGNFGGGGRFGGGGAVGGGTGTGGGR